MLPGRTLHPRVADLRVAGGHALPLLGGERVERGREEDLLLLVDHVVDHLQRFGERSRERPDVTPLGVGAIGLDARADVVVETPHDLGGTDDAVLLEYGEQLVLLAKIVNVDLGEAGEAAADLIEGFASTIARQIRVAGYRLELATQLARDLADHHVLPPIRVERMLLAHLDGLLRIERLPEHGDVNIAQALDVLDGHALGDERLLHLGDLRRIDVADQLVEARLDLLDRCAVM